MSRTFAQIVERVKQLSLDEKEELLGLLNESLIEGAGGEAKGHVVASEFAKETRTNKADLAELVSRMPADDQATQEGLDEPVGKEEW